MLIAVAPIATLPIAVPDADYAVPDPLQALYADPDAEYVFLLKADPLDVEAAESTWPYAVATEPLASLSEEDAALPTSLYLSDRGFATGPDEAEIPNQPFPPRLLVPYSYEVSVPLPGSGEARGRSSFGAIEIDNSDGAYDYLTRATWSGRPVEVRIGGTIDRGRATERTLSYGEFGTLFRGTVATVTWTDSRIYLSLVDKSELLDRPVQRRLYKGTGGAEGGEDLTGLPRPLGWGQVRKAAPPLVDATGLVYQLHDGAIEAVDGVWDKGVPLTPAGTDYADYDALVEASVGAAQSGADIEAGEYATCLAGGYIRLGGEPAGQITVDFRGDNAGDQGYVSSAARIARRVALWRGDLTANDLDAASIHALHLANPAAVGYWTGTRQVTAAEIIDALLVSIDSYWYFDRLGRLVMGRHVDPTAAPALMTLTAADLVADSLERLETPEPVHTVRLGYRRFWQPQNPNELAESLTAAERQALGGEYRYATAADAGVQETYRSARQVERNTLIDDAADAAAEAARRLSRDKRGRDLYRLRKRRRFFAHAPGDVVRLALDAVDLDEGRNLTLVRLTEDAAPLETTIEGWG